MQKGERLEISVSVLLTEELDDDVAIGLGRMAVRAATAVLVDNGKERKRLCSGVSIGPAIQGHRVKRRQPHPERGARRSFNTIGEPERKQ